MVAEWPRDLSGIAHSSSSPLACTPSKPEAVKGPPDFDLDPHRQHASSVSSSSSGVTINRGPVMRLVGVATTLKFKTAIKDQSSHLLIDQSCLLTQKGDDIDFTQHHGEEEVDFCLSVYSIRNQERDCSCCRWNLSLGRCPRMSIHKPRTRTT